MDRTPFLPDETMVSPRRQVSVGPGPLQRTAVSILVGCQRRLRWRAGSVCRPHLPSVISASLRAIAEMMRAREPPGMTALSICCAVALTTAASTAAGRELACRNVVALARIMLASGDRQVGRPRSHLGAWVPLLNSELKHRREQQQRREYDPCNEQLRVRSPREIDRSIRPADCGRARSNPSKESQKSKRAKDLTPCGAEPGGEDPCRRRRSDAREARLRGG
jgi:hypothetical protein